MLLPFLGFFFRKESCQIFRKNTSTSLAEPAHSNENHPAAQDDASGMESTVPSRRTEGIACCYPGVRRGIKATMTCKNTIPTNNSLPQMPDRSTQDRNCSVLPQRNHGDTDIPANHTTQNSIK